MGQKMSENSHDENIPKGLRKIRQYFDTTEQDLEIRENYRMLSPEEIEGKPTFQLMDELNL